MASKHHLGYWAGVLGTAMFFMGFLGVAHGWMTVTVGEQLQNFSVAIHDHRFGIAIGGVLQGASFGVLSLAGVETAQAAKKLIDIMPSPQFLETVGFIRIGISTIAIVIGIFLALRFRWAILAGAAWGVLSVTWFIYVTWKSWELLNESLGNPISGFNSPIYIVDSMLHLVWPILLASILVPAYIRGRRRGWKLVS